MATKKEKTIKFKYIPSPKSPKLSHFGGELLVQGENTTTEKLSNTKAFKTRVEQGIFDVVETQVKTPVAKKTTTKKAVTSKTEVKDGGND